MPLDTPPITRALLIANVVVYLLQQVMGDALLVHFALWPLGPSPYGDVPGFEPWQLVSYAFLHGSFAHIAFNMLALWMFGGPIEQLFGSRPFLLYYLVCAVGAALTQLDSLAQSIFLDVQLLPGNGHLVPLSATAESSRGSFVNGPFGSDLLTNELTTQGIPVIYIRDIRDGEYQRVSTNCVSAEKARKLSVCSVRPGDVLIAKVGDPPGTAAIYPYGAEPAIITQDVVRIRVDPSRYVPEFLVGYLNSEIGRRKVAEITVQATRARFSLRDFKQLMVELPSLPIQKRFASRITAIENLKATQRAALTELDSLFASLQHRAFRGEL